MQHPQFGVRHSVTAPSDRPGPFTVGILMVLLVVAPGCGINSPNQATKGIGQGREVTSPTLTVSCGSDGPEISRQDVQATSAG